ncbi:MAG: acetate--CoA ligase family protein [Deltaproteobacteria bacterium]|nr:acetate--CoA ligase family protein [Deltaproteobacteria bacterium]
MKIIDDAINKGIKTLSEHASKEVLKNYSVPVTEEYLAKDVEEAIKYAQKIGYPVVLKGSSSTLTHKTEMNLVEVGIKDEESLVEAFNAIEKRGGSQLDGILVQEMIKGERELVAGLTRDPQFGPCVMFGLGGIFTEVLKDVTFRVAPLERYDAYEMMDEIKAKKILDEFRGKPAVDREKLADILINLGRIGLEHEEVAEIDINPLIIKDSMPVAVDALIVLRAETN